MIVVSDTSALTSLLQVGLEEILPRLFQEVAIPEAVERELRRAHPVQESRSLRVRDVHDLHAEETEPDSAAVAIEAIPRHV